MRIGYILSNSIIIEVENNAVNNAIYYFNAINKRNQ